MVRDALDYAPHRISTLLFTKDQAEILNHTSLLPSQVLIEVSETDFRKVSSLKNPQGILAVLTKADNTVREENDPGDLVLILEDIRDPGNFGTILRLADWFGITTVYCSESTVDVYNPKVIQASMGAFLNVRVVYTDLAHLVSDLKNTKGFTVYGTSLTGTPHYTSNPVKPAAILLGNEGSGLSDSLLQACDKNLYITRNSAFRGGAESLNVSVAAAIICAEFRRE